MVQPLYGCFKYLVSVTSVKTLFFSVKLLIPATHSLDVVQHRKYWSHMNFFRAMYLASPAQTQQLLLILIQEPLALPAALSPQCL